MLCSQCGHENPSTAKFCNECGKLIDRRKSERRQGDRRKSVASVAPQEGVASRRPSPLPSLTPGQENAQGHTPARQAAEAFLRRDRSFRGPEQMPVEDARESGAPLRPNVIVTSRGENLEPDHISGPSFLGLAGSGRSDDRADYLLDDEPRNGWRKWLVLVILVIIGLLVYMQWHPNWRAQQHDELPTPPAERSGEAPQKPTPQPTSNDADKQAPPAQQSADAKDAKPDVTKQEDGSKPAAGETSSAKPPSAEAQQPSGDDGNDEAEEQAANTGKPPAQSTRNAKRSGAIAPIAEHAPDPMVQRAQRYLYGAGVPQNCDQAMLYLRAATEKPSVPARSQMGALYATGTCVPQDRVRAYQWFTAAYQLAPNSFSLQRQRLQIWAQMSSAERQRALNNPR